MNKGAFYFHRKSDMVQPVRLPLVILALVVQVALGLSNVYWHLPVSVAVAHNAGGALVLLTLGALNYYLLMAQVRGENFG